MKNIMMLVRKDKKMKFKMLVVTAFAVAALSGLGAVAHAEVHLSNWSSADLSRKVYYYDENGQQVVVTLADASHMTAAEMITLCGNVVKSAQRIKESDPVAGKIAVHAYALDQYYPLHDLAKLPVLKDAEMSIPPGDMEDVVRGAQAIVAHNQAAEQGRKALRSAIQSLLDMVSGKPNSDECQALGLNCPG